MQVAGGRCRLQVTIELRLHLLAVFLQTDGVLTVT